MEVREASAEYQVAPAYKQTEVGLIPEDWKAEKLGVHATFRTGPFGSALHQSDYVHGGVPVINPMQIVDGKIIPTPSMAVSECSAKKLSDFRVAQNEIVIGRRGDMGRCALVAKEQAGWLCGTGSMIVRTKPSLDSGYAQRVLSSAPVIAQIENMSVGTTMINLNQGTLRELVIPVPADVAEQKAIASALSDTDALIEALEELLAKKRQIKQGAMQELLTGHRHLHGFAGEWAFKPMHRLGTTYGGLTGKTKRDFGQGEARYIPFMNVMSSTVIDSNWLETVNVGASESQNATKAGDLFFNGSSETPEEVGFCAVLNEDIPRLYLNSFCFGFRFNTEAKANGLFLAYWFRSKNGRKAMALLAQGATRYNIAKSAFLKLEVPQPSEEEQTAIATVLADMDADIAALEAKLTKARELKQGMMQQLLTGRIRLV